MKIRVDELWVAVKQGVITDFERSELLDKINKLKFIHEHSKIKKDRKYAKKELQTIKKKMEKINRLALQPKTKDIALWYIQDLVRLLAYYYPHKESDYYFITRAEETSKVVESGSLGEEKLQNVLWEVKKHQQNLKKTNEELENKGMLPVYSEGMTNLYIDTYKRLADISISLDKELSLCSKPLLHTTASEERKAKQTELQSNKHTKVFKTTLKKLESIVIDEPFLEWDKSFLTHCIVDIRMIEKYSKEGHIPQYTQKALKPAIKDLKKVLMDIESLIKDFRRT